MNRDFKGIWIPAEIWLDERLSSTEKMLFTEISSLHDPEKGGCFAGNEYLANFLGLKERQIRSNISHLKSLGLIKQTAFNGRERILTSYLDLPIREAENCRAGMSFTAGLLHIRENKEEKSKTSSFSKKKATSTPDASKYHYLSELLIFKIKASGTEMLIKPERDIPKWAQDFRLMVEQDRKTEKQIENVIEEIFADSFWSKQVRCASKLREHWNGGKFDRLKDSQNAQEGQEGGKPLTGWQQLCRDHGDAGNAVFDKFCKVWDSIEPGVWEHYPHFPKRTAVLEIMKPIYEIMVANNCDPRKIVELGKACFEQQKAEALERQKNAKNTSAI